MLVACSPLLFSVAPIARNYEGRVESKATQLLFMFTVCTLCHHLLHHADFKCTFILSTDVFLQVVESYYGHVKYESSVSCIYFVTITLM